MCNLIKNPSFEVGLDGWEPDNVSIDSLSAFEGTQAARLNSGIASIYQDVTLPGIETGPLLLSFSAFSEYGQADRPKRGSLIVEVIWQNGHGAPLGTGLRLVIPGTMLVDNPDRLTYVEVTDKPPANAVKARLKFSKGVLISGAEPGVVSNPILIDQVILSPLEDINLITNPGFQERLSHWNETNSVAGGFGQYEGTNYAILNSDGGGTIFQDVPISGLPANSSFLLSFAARFGSDMSVTVEYRDNVGPLGTGLSLLIPSSVLNKDGWKTYAVATETAAPAGAAVARVSFGGANVHVDKVILTMVKTPNLLLNPSFEAGLANWISENFNIIAGDNYEGSQHAGAAGAAFIYQDTSIESGDGCCYLLTFGAQATSLQSDALVEVIWLDSEGREIGLGSSFVIPESALTRQTQDGTLGRRWAAFVAVTEPSPPEAVFARVLFSVADSSPLELDMVSFTRLFCPPTPPLPTRGIKLVDI